MVQNNYYKRVHVWINKRLGNPQKCLFCKTIKAKKYEWANKSGKYKWDIKDWLRLCVKCHKKYDDVGNKVHKARIINGTTGFGKYQKKYKKVIKYKNCIFCNKKFNKPFYRSYINWKESKFCSILCRTKFPRTRGYSNKKIKTKKICLLCE
ncbi:MAG: hypothetical protein AABY22_13265, partial [Nanoarchaeota archaeon]